MIQTPENKQSVMSQETKKVSKTQFSLQFLFLATKESRTRQQGS